jgi:hypothetical protein
MGNDFKDCYGYTNLPGTCSTPVPRKHTYSGNFRLITVDTTTPGTYNAVYTVTAEGGHTVTKTIPIKVTCDPVNNIIV